MLVINDCAIYFQSCQTCILSMLQRRRKSLLITVQNVCLCQICYRYVLMRYCNHNFFYQSVQFSLPETLFLLLKDFDYIFAYFSYIFYLYFDFPNTGYIQEKKREIVKGGKDISKPFFCCASPFLVFVKLVKEQCIRGNSSGHFLHKKTNTAGDRCASHPHSQCHIYNTLEKKYSLIQYILRMNE